MNDNLEPIWDEIEEIVSRENIFALLMVHYFGQPQNIDKYKKFCKDNHIFLIEDNAHGHGGKFNGKPLGSYGDAGFSSPRKFINISFGGCLYIRDIELENLPYSVSKTDSIQNVYDLYLKSFDKITSHDIPDTNEKSNDFHWFSLKFFRFFDKNLSFFLDNIFFEN